MSGLPLAVLIAACGGVQRDALPEDASDALVDLAKECDRERFDACVELGLRYQSGDGVPQDVYVAADLIGVACEVEGLGCELSELAALPIDVLPEIESVVAACDADDADACETIGRMYWTGDVVPEDREHGMRLLRPLCTSGSWSACAHSERLRLAGFGTPDSVALAEQCDAHDADACFELAQRYESGSDVPLNPDSAARLWELSCEMDHALGCFSFGEAYRFGQLGDASMSRAEPYLMRACELGHEPACGSGESLMLPDGTTNAARYDARRCDLGEDTACFDLAVRYLEGDGLERSESHAMSQLHALCDEGGRVGDAACLRASQVDARSGDPARVAQATVWFSEVCGLGNGTACHAWGEQSDAIGERASAIAAWERGCVLGNAQSCEALPGPIELQIGDAAGWAYARDCDDGVIESCERLVTLGANAGNPIWAQYAAYRVCATRGFETCPYPGVSIPGLCGWVEQGSTSPVALEVSYDGVGRLARMAIIRESHGVWQSEFVFAYDDTGRTLTATNRGSRPAASVPVSSSDIRLLYAMLVYSGSGIGWAWDTVMTWATSETPQIVRDDVGHVIELASSDVPVLQLEWSSGNLSIANTPTDSAQLAFRWTDGQVRSVDWTDTDGSGGYRWDHDSLGRPERARPTGGAHTEELLIDDSCWVL